MSDSEALALQAVHSYAAALHDHLRGERKLRRAISAEVKDHLLAAIELREVGDDPLVAADAAIQGFGAPDICARTFQPVIDRLEARRTSLGLLFGVAVVAGLWLAIFLTGPPAPWSESLEPPVAALSDAMGSLAMLVALATALVAVGWSWFVPRWSRSATPEAVTEQLRRCSGFGIAALVVAATMILAYTLSRGLLAPSSVEWSDITIGVFLTAGVVIALASRVARPAGS